MPPPYFSGFNHNGVSWGFREAAEDAALGGRWDADWTISRDGAFIGLAKLGDSNELLLTFPGTEQPSHDELMAIAKHLGADGYAAPHLGGRRIPAW